MLIDTIIANLANVPLEDRENPQAVVKNFQNTLSDVLNKVIIVNLNLYELRNGRLVQPRNTNPKPVEAAQPEAPQPIVEPVAPEVPVPVVQDVQAPLEAVGAV